MTRHPGFSGLGATIILMASAGAAAEPPPPMPAVDEMPGIAALPAATLEQLVADLNSPDFHTRELATVRLRDDKAISLSRIEEILTTQELPLEAHARLITIARERFSTSPRAAMGVQFDLATLRDRIVIDKTLEPFDCHRVLEPGDIIIEADGIPLPRGAARTKIQGLIISRDPGDTMTLVVRRGKEKLTVAVKLGDFRELRSNTLDELRLYRAWKERSAAYTRAEAPMTTPVHADAWPDAVEVNRQRQMQQMRNQAHNPVIVVHAGGRARTANVSADGAWYNAQVRGMNGGRLNAWGANAQALQMVLEFDDPSPQPPMTYAEEADRLAQKRSAIDGQLDRARREVARAAPGSAEAALLVSRVVQAELDIRTVERQLQAIAAEKEELEGKAAKKRSPATITEQDE